MWVGYFGFGISSSGVVGLLIGGFFFFSPIFEMGLVIGMLNWCGFELAVGY